MLKIAVTIFEIYDNIKFGRALISFLSRNPFSLAEYLLIFGIRTQLNLMFILFNSDNCWSLETSLSGVHLYTFCNSDKDFF